MALPPRNLILEIENNSLLGGLIYGIKLFPTIFRKEQFSCDVSLAG